MNKKRKTFLSALAGLSLILMCGLPPVHAEADDRADILFVHDTHSHLNEFATVEDGESQILGGFSKIKTLTKTNKNELIF